MRHIRIAEDCRDVKIEWGILKKFLPRFIPYRKSLLFCIFLMVSYSFLSLAGPLLIRHAIDFNFKYKDFPGLMKTAGLYLLVLILSLSVNYFQRINLEIIGQQIIKKIRIDIFTHLTKMPQKFFDENPVGQMLSRVESDTEAVRQMFTYTVVVIITNVLMLLGVFTVMFFISPGLTLILLSLAPPIVFTVIYYNNKIIPLYVEVRKRTADVYAFLEEYLRGAVIIQAFSQEKNIMKKMDTINKAKLDMEYPARKYETVFGQIIFFLSVVATALILGTGGYWVLKSSGSDSAGLTIGTLVAFLAYIQRFFGPIFQLSDQINVIQRAFAGIKRIDDIMEKSLPLYSDSDKGREIPLSEGKKEGIEFRNVWFAYKDEEWVLKDVSFYLSKGQRLAIVGPTGSGKTTVTSLLFKFYEPQKGEILVDGTDIKTIPVDILRKKLGLVLQDIILFPGNILDNLRMENEEISEDYVMKAIEEAGAKDLIEKLPEKLKTPLAEHGKNLSMGERQLLSFVRAMVFDPEILILDEATSSIDPSTEKKIQKATQTLLIGRTSIIIAHRLETILECDKILVLEKGSIKERGSHKELLDKKGIYWNLYQIQMGQKEAVK